MQNNNAVLPFTGATGQQLAETIGITQFPSETNWYQTIGGLLVQGGFLSGIVGGSTTVVPFPAPYPTQVLGVFIQVVGGAENGSYINLPSLEDFPLVCGAGNRDFFWWSVGV